MSTELPPIALLGVVERAARIRDGNTNLFKYNLIGLKRTIVSHLFPLVFSSLHYAFALYAPKVGLELRLKIKDEAGHEVGKLGITVQSLATLQPTTEDMAIKREGMIVDIPLEGWTFVTIPPSKGVAMIPKPGIYTFSVDSEGEEFAIGQLNFVLIDPEPLSASRIAAIRSDPSAVKAVRAKILCSVCSETIQAYAGLERVPESEAEGYVWYENLPDSFSCSCGRTTVDLSTYRRNLHSLLGSPFNLSGEMAFLPLYEKGSLVNTRMNFAALLEQVAPEETFQVFLEENPILLHQFSPEQIFFKAPILNLYNTDFAILNPQRQLLLIELERPDTRILKKDGGIHSELQHAFDQTRNWLQAADDQRSAVLYCIRIDPKQVGAVQAVIIAGRDTDYDQEALRKLKGADLGRTKFMTYDDLLAGLDALIRTVEQL
jgi:hypothetical protein